MRSDHPFRVLLAILVVVVSGAAGTAWAKKDKDDDKPGQRRDNTPRVEAPRIGQGNPGNDARRFNPPQSNSFKSNEPPRQTISQPVPSVRDRITTQIDNSRSQPKVLSPPSNNNSPPGLQRFPSGGTTQSAPRVLSQPDNSAPRVLTQPNNSNPRVFSQPNNPARVVNPPVDSTPRVTQPSTNPNPSGRVFSTNPSQIPSNPKRIGDVLNQTDNLNKGRDNNNPANFPPSRTGIPSTGPIDSKVGKVGTPGGPKVGTSAPGPLGGVKGNLPGTPGGTPGSNPGTVGGPTRTPGTIGGGGNVPDTARDRLPPGVRDRIGGPTDTKVGKPVLPGGVIPGTGNPTAGGVGTTPDPTKVKDDIRRRIDQGNIAGEKHPPKREMPRREHDLTKAPPELNEKIQNLSKLSWAKGVDPHRLDRLTSGTHTEKHKLDKQFSLQEKGDVARRLNLSQNLIAAGGWSNRPVSGPVSPNYRTHCFHRSYAGPGWFPSACWYPVWSSWVNWSWYYTPQALWDPRPIYCRPYYYQPCTAWVSWNTPAWQALPVVSSGTWVNAPVVNVVSGLDVQLLAMRFVDPGHPESNLGVRYRAWVRNNSAQPISAPFNVMAFATQGNSLQGERIEAGVRVPSLDAGQVLPIDIRLPLAIAGAAQPYDFDTLHLIVDSHRELNDDNLSNNGILIARGNVLSVDPAVFSSDVERDPSGSLLLTLAGEGLGPEPGEVVMQVGDQQVPLEVLGWYDLGVRVRAPNVALNTAETVVIRGDGAASNPLEIQFAATEPTPAIEF